jgi:hypothetical protein
MLPSKYNTAVPVPENDITLSLGSPQLVYSKCPSVNEVAVKLPDGDNAGKGVTNEKVGIELHDPPLHEFPLEIDVPPLAESECELEKMSVHCVACAQKIPAINIKNALKLRKSINYFPKKKEVIAIYYIVSAKYKRS